MYVREVYSMFIKQEKICVGNSIFIRTIADVTTAVVKVVIDTIICSTHNSIENNPK